MKRRSKMKNKFKIGERVWLRIPESDLGIVSDIIYRFSTRKFEYSICFGWGRYCVCEEYELSSVKEYN